MYKVLSKIIPKNKKPTQKEVVDFVTDKNTIDSAARGSMKKRNDLLQSVEMKQKHAYYTHGA